VIPVRDVEANRKLNFGAGIVEVDMGESSASKGRKKPASEAGVAQNDPLHSAGGDWMDSVRGV
jgi:hypothetical protein